MTFDRAVLARALPFAVYILFLALNQPLSQLCDWLNVDVKWLYILRIAVVAALLLYFWRDYAELKRKPVRSDFLYAGIAGLLVLVIWIFPYPDWLGGGDTQGFNPLQNETELTALFWMSTRIMGAALLVPVMEELFWRSFVMRWFDKADFLKVLPEKISGYAYVGSACLFALEHHLWLAGLFAGLVYGELYKTYRNLWIPIFAHAVTNGLLGIWIVFTGNWQYW
ncbi:MULTISPECIES: CAAX prenyl protease-related protein [Methylotenera]|uniref:CAAX prenyl protease-related protein n=1 Tax=Methylotenera TaxID=359407 RepID=UPI00037A33A8|nr:MULTISPECIES: CAAX prenyl protease-related protein [Methylotenera]